MVYLFHHQETKKIILGALCDIVYQNNLDITENFENKIEDSFLFYARIYYDIPFCHYPLQHNSNLYRFLKLIDLILSTYIQETNDIENICSFYVRNKSKESIFSSDFSSSPTPNSQIINNIYNSLFSNLYSLEQLNSLFELSQNKDLLIQFTDIYLLFLFDKFLETKKTFKNHQRSEFFTELYGKLLNNLINNSINFCKYNKNHDKSWPELITEMFFEVQTSTSFNLGQETIQLINEFLT